MNKIIIVLPTLNEFKNIQKLFFKIKLLKYKFIYLIIDHGSTDGTQELINKLKKKYPKEIYIIQKTKREGIGKAHKDGLKWAYKKKYNCVITMDTDFAHNPKFIKKLIFKSKTSDLVVGSRYLKKNSAPNWSIFRIFLSKGAHFMSKLLFDINYDTTNSFRLYNLKKINKNFLNKCKSNDYDFFFTSIVLLYYRKYKISEIPMTIKGRSEGSSKMYIQHIIKSVLNMFLLFIKLKFRIIK